MAAFVIFDQATGAVQGTYTIAPASKLEQSMKLNTPKGCGALPVPVGHPSAKNNAGWKVIDGKLTVVNQ